MGSTVIPTGAGSPVDDPSANPKQAQKGSFTATSAANGGAIAASPVLATQPVVAAQPVVYLVQPALVQSPVLGSGTLVTGTPFGVGDATGTVVGGGPGVNTDLVTGYLPPEFADLGKVQPGALGGGSAATGGIAPIQLGNNPTQTTAAAKDSSGCTMPDCPMHGGTGKGHTYKVRKGDTLASIAKRFGVTAAALRAANPSQLADGAQPHKGQVLCLPANARSGSAVSQPSSIRSLASFPKSNATKAQVAQYIQWAARQYGANPTLMVEIARRESGLSPVSVNNWDSNAQRGTPSKGVMQFIKPTFDAFAPQARAANPEAWKGLGALDWLDWRQQALAAAWAIHTGRGGNWATYSAARHTAGV